MVEYYASNLCFTCTFRNKCFITSLRISFVFWSYLPSLFHVLWDPPPFAPNFVFFFSSKDSLGNLNILEWIAFHWSILDLSEIMYIQNWQQLTIALTLWLGAEPHSQGLSPCWDLVWFWLLQVVCIAATDALYWGGNLLKNIVTHFYWVIYLYITDRNISIFWIYIW